MGHLFDIIDMDLMAIFMGNKKQALALQFEMKEKNVREGQRYRLK